MDSVNIVTRQLHVPSLEELQNLLLEAVLKNFAEAQVEIVDCPDLTQEPFTLAATGLGGKPKILEIGGPAYLLPIVQRDKIYEITELAAKLDYNGDVHFIIGAGAGPWPHAKTNCEMMMNVKFSTCKDMENQTRIAIVDVENSNVCKLSTLPNNETRFSLLANLYLCEGKPGKVLKVGAKKRTGPQDFIACMQKALAEKYKNELVGLGGSFLLKKGKAKQHVMQDFSKTPINTEKQLNEWLKFYDMSAPLVAVGTFVSAETTDLDLRVQHFHSFSHHGEGGHYHIDTTPTDVEYVGYFNVADTLYRVDQPPNLLQFGKD